MLASLLISCALDPAGDGLRDPTVERAPELPSAYRWGDDEDEDEDDEECPPPAPDPQWIQIVATEALSDPSGLTTGSTGAVAGLVTFEPLDSGVPLVDGYREDLPLFSVPVLDLFPDFDPLTDVLDLRAEVASMPLDSGKYGLALFVSDGDPANRSAWNVGGVQVYPNSATVINGGLMGADAQGSSAVVGSNLLPVTHLVGRFWWHAEPVPTVRVGGQVLKSGGTVVPLTAVGKTGAGFSGDLADWRVNVGLLHASATDAAEALIQARWYARRIRGADPFP